MIPEDQSAKALYPA